MKPVSEFASHFGSNTAILQVMEDLSTHIGTDVCMLGGGNPAHIPSVETTLRATLQELLDDPARCSRLLGDYDHPQGNADCIRALVELLNREYAWGVREQNILLSNGSQCGFFMLFNLFAGRYTDGSWRRILLPLVPDYVGYANLGLAPDMLTAIHGQLTLLGEHEFKYHLDTQALHASTGLGAICVSRPANPSGNVLSDTEIRTLHNLARQRDIPLIIDCAYGAPFPNILNVPVTPFWDRHIVYCLSLSKLGLPGTRTGIIVADEAIIQRLININGILNLANANLGPGLAHRLFDSGAALRLSREVIQPYYRARAKTATAALHQALAGMHYRLHRPEGGIFLWLYLPELPVPDQQLYQRLKERGVIVLPGHYFFPGFAGDSPHRHHCLRLSYAGDEQRFAAAMNVLADELRDLERD